MSFLVIMSSVFCEYCKLHFSSRSRFKVHRADFHQGKLDVAALGSSEVVQISRDSKGAWRCICGHTQIGNGCTQRMRRHVKICRSLRPVSECPKEGYPESSNSRGIVPRTLKGSAREKTLRHVSSLVGNIDERLEMSTKCALDADRRCIDAFVARTKWHEAIGDLASDLVEAYVSRPLQGDSKETVIYSACRIFLQKVGELERTTPFLTLRFLGPQSDGSKPGRDPFRTVQEVSTLQKYADYLGRLVLMIWRRSRIERFKVMPRINERLSDAARNLGRSVDDVVTGKECSPEVQKALRLLLREVFCVTLPVSCQRDDHVVAQFAMFRNLSVSRGWAGPEEAGYTVAALSYACRSTILCWIRERNSKEEDMKLMFQFVSTESNTAFCALQDLMRIAAYTHANEWAAGLKVVWSTEHPEWTTLAIGSSLINLEDFADGLTELWHEASRILGRDILLGMQISEKEWDNVFQSMKENIRETRVGHSLFHERSNPQLAQMQNYLIRHICHSSDIYSQFFSGSEVADAIVNSPPWKEGRLQRWFEKVYSFVDCLIPLVHVLGGGPARAQEIASLAILNTETGMRNLYWMNGGVMLVTRYHKSQSVTGRGRPVARFLPKKVSDLVVKYIALVKPFESVVAGVLYGGRGAEEAHRTYLFAKRGKRMEGQGICSSFSLAMHKVVDFGLKLSDYRHFYTTVAKKFLAGLSQEEGNLPFHEQAAHSAETGEHTYGITSSDHQQITTNKILLFWRCSNEWQSLFHFAESKRGWDQAPKMLGKRGWEDTKRPERTEGPVILSPYSLRARHHAGMEEILTEWRRSRDQDLEGVQGSKKRLITLSLPPLGPAESGELLSGLRRFLEDARASFLSKWQILAAREVLRGRNDLLVVMPTGSGKTLTYMLPIWMECNGARGPGRMRTSIVVVPLVALMKDIRRRFERSGISVGEWVERDRHPTVLLVSVEVTAGLGFLSYVNSLAARGDLARIVVEEAHVRITWERFRPKLKALGLVRPGAGIPLVLLTGTLPPLLESELAIKMGSPFSTIRMPTSRPNLSYRVIYVDEKASGFENQFWGTQVHAALPGVVQNFKEMLKPSSSRAIVYCPTRAECQAVTLTLQKFISVSCYHRGMDPVERNVSDEAWRGGRSKVMVATSAFGTGIDFPGVRLVVHLGYSSSILDYAQETGRAGRDGKLGVCVTIAHKGFLMSLTRCSEKRINKSVENLGRTEEDCVLPQRDSRKEKEYPGGVLEFLEFISPFESEEQPKCRRQQLQLYLDGEADNCLSAGADFALCDICEEIALKSRSFNSCAISSAHESTVLHKGEAKRTPIKISRETSKPLSLCEGPSKVVRDAGMATQRRRSRIEQALERASEGARVLGDCCVICSVIRGKLYNKHGKHEECEEGKHRCLRCYAIDHRVRECTLPRYYRSDVDRRGTCFKCGIFHNERRGWGKWGNECNSGLEHARSALLAVWHGKREWLSENFKDCSRIRSLAEYDKWLFRQVGEYEAPRLVEVFNKWWIAFHEQMD